MRKMCLKIVVFTILMLIYVKRRQPIVNLCNTNLKPKNLSHIPLNIENNMMSMLFLSNTLF